MADVQKRDIKRNIRKMKRTFLESCKSLGGDKMEFITQVVGDIDKATEGVEVKDALKEMVAGYAASIWESKSKRNDDQLVIAGCEIDQEIRYPDENSPTGYTTVLARYCTIRQHRLSIAMIEAERDDLGAKAKEQRKANEAATKKASGNLDALMSKFADKLVKA